MGRKMHITILTQLRIDCSGAVSGEISRLFAFICRGESNNRISFVARESESWQRDGNLFIGGSDVFNRSYQLVLLFSALCLFVIILSVALQPHILNVSFHPVVTFIKDGIRQHSNGFRSWLAISDFSSQH